jgi:hypothetical protein
MNHSSIAGARMYGTEPPTSIHLKQAKFPRTRPRVGHEVKDILTIKAGE